MRTIWKFKLGVSTTINVPVLSVPRHVAMQGNDLMLWVDLDPTIEQMEFRTFNVVGTGHPITRDSTYVGTCLDGEFVWHVYEEVT